MMAVKTVVALASKYNQTIDYGTGCALHALTHYSDPSTQQIVRKVFEAQSKMSLHLLGTSLISQATIGNSYLSKEVGCYLAFIGVFATIGPLIGYLKRHATALARLPRLELTTALAVPIILGIGAIINFQRKSVDKSITMHIWGIYMGLDISIGLHLMLIIREMSQAANREARGGAGAPAGWGAIIPRWARPAESGLVPIGRQRIGPVESAEHANKILKASIESEVIALQAAILDIKNKIKILDDFGTKYADLAATVKEAAKDYKPIYADYKPPSTAHLDEETPVGKMTLLQAEKSRLEADLEERLVFIERNEKVYDCFKKHLVKSGVDGITGGLIRDR